MHKKMSIHPLTSIYPIQGHRGLKPRGRVQPEHVTSLFQGKPTETAIHTP